MPKSRLTTFVPAANEEDHFKLIDDNVSSYIKLVEGSERLFQFEVKPDEMSKLSKDINVRDNTNFTEQFQIQLSPFVFWILQENDIAGFGETLSPPVNHRMPNQTIFSAKSGSSNLTDTLLDPSTDSSHQKLQNGEIKSLPYVIKRAKKVDGIQLADFQSNASFTWKDQNRTVHNAWIRAKGVSAGRPDWRYYKGLASFFGHHLSLKQDDNSILKGYEDKVNFNTLFQLLSTATIFNIDTLNAILKHMSMPFKYKEQGDSSENHNTILAFAHFSAFFRFITPLRLTQLEGGHRTFMINRVFRGVDIATSTIPIGLQNHSNQIVHKSFPNSGTLMSHLPLTLVYLKSNKERQKMYKLQKSPGDYICHQDIDTMKHFSKIAQELRTTVYGDSFANVLRTAVHKITVLGPNPIKDDSDFWSQPEDYFVSKENDGFITFLSSCLEIMINELFSSKYFELSKLSGDKEEALNHFTNKDGQQRNIFLNKTLTAPYVKKRENSASTTYYERYPKAPLKKGNSYNSPLWVSLWLVKTSLARRTTFAKLSDFLGVDSLQKILTPEWLMDSIITPVETLTRHYLDSHFTNNSKSDNRKSKLYFFFRAFFLEYYLSELAQCDLPTKFDELNNNQDDDKGQHDVDDILYNEQNKDVLHLQNQIRAGKRFDGDYAYPFLSAICVLYAVSARLKTDENYLSEIIKVINKGTATVSVDQMEAFLDKIKAVKPFGAHDYSLRAFIASKTTLTSQGGFPLQYIEVFAPPAKNDTPSKKRRRDDEDEEFPINPPEPLSFTTHQNLLTQEETDLVTKSINHYLQSNAKKHKEDVYLFKQNLQNIIDKLPVPLDKKLRIEQGKIILAEREIKSHPV